jgi:hypothetical protein
MLGATLGVPRGLLLHVLEESWLESLKRFIGSPAEVERGNLDDASSSLGNWPKDPTGIGLFLRDPVRKGSTLDGSPRLLHITTCSWWVLTVGTRTDPGPWHYRQRLLAKRVHLSLLLRASLTGRIGDPRCRRFLTEFPKAMEGCSAIAPEALVRVVHVYEPLPKGR